MYIELSKSGGEDPISLTEGQSVAKGDLIAYSYGRSYFPHLHFEVRHGGTGYKRCCNPWKYLPNTDTSFEATLTLTPNYNGIECQAVVNVSVPPDQLTFNRVELHILDSSDTPQKVRFYDMCGTNSNRTKSQISNPNYLEDPNDDSSYLIRISPKKFTSYYLAQGKNAKYGFEFVDLPSGGGTVMARIIDVFNNSVSTTYSTYSCS